MTIKISKTNTDKKATFLRSCKRNLKMIFELKKQREMAYEVKLLRMAIADPSVWYSRIAIEK